MELKELYESWLHEILENIDYSWAYTVKREISEGIAMVLDAKKLSNVYVVERSLTLTKTDEESSLWSFFILYTIQGDSIECHYLSPDSIAMFDDIIVWFSTYETSNWVFYENFLVDNQEWKIYTFENIFRFDKEFANLVLRWDEVVSEVYRFDDYFILILNDWRYIFLKIEDWKLFPCYYNDEFESPNKFSKVWKKHPKPILFFEDFEELFWRVVLKDFESIWLEDLSY